MIQNRERVTKVMNLILRQEKATMGMKPILPREMQMELNLKKEKATKGMELILPREKVTKGGNDSEVPK